MAITNRAYALLELAQWCRHHGIIEIREVLAKAVNCAGTAQSNEEVGMMLEQVALTPECPLPAPKEAEAPVEVTMTKPRAKANASA